MAHEPDDSAEEDLERSGGRCPIECFTVEGGTATAPDGLVEQVSPTPDPGGGQGDESQEVSESLEAEHRDPVRLLSSSMLAGMLETFLTTVTEDCCLVRPAPLKPKVHPDRKVKVLLEFACSLNSSLGRVGNTLGWTVIRFTKETHDLTTMGGLRAAMQTARQNPGADLWGSLRCTSWCRWHSMNISKLVSAFQDKLQAQRRKSLTTVRYFRLLAKEVRANGGDVHYEWPVYNEGWQQPEVVKLTTELGTHTAICHGCMLGAVDKDGDPIKKPLRVETTNQALAEELSKHTCSGEHVHARCESSNTERTGYDPDQMAGAILKAIAREPCIAQGQNLPEAFVASKDKLEAFNRLPASERDRLIRIARKLHANSGHRNVQALARHLRQRSAPLESRAAMEAVKCDACENIADRRTSRDIRF